MMRVIYRDSDRTIFSDPFDEPNPPLAIGDKLQFALGCTTLGNEHFDRFETIEVVGFTDDAPHNRITTKGNLLIKGKGRVSVWSNIEWLMSDGYIVRAVQ